MSGMVKLPGPWHRSSWKTKFKNSQHLYNWRF